MGLQLIFVVETNKKCNSDWIYIKETFNQLYSYNQAHVKLSVVYMDGKGKYQTKKKEVDKCIKSYKAGSKESKSEVIYCFDCDDYDTNPADLKFLKDAQQFCAQNGYKFVWFCKDIESVYLGKKVPDAKKKNEAASFKAKGGIRNVTIKNLESTTRKDRCSNLLLVLDEFDEYLTRKS